MKKLTQIRSAIVLIMLTLVSFGAKAQTTLSPGDIVIIGMRSDLPRSFRFVPLVPLAANTVIYFTDSGWMGSSFRANEGAVKYTAPAGGVAAGTNIEFTGVTGPFMNANDANVGTGGFLLSNSGDQLLAFQGSTAAPNFIFAIQSNSTQWQATATNANTSALPTGLTNGVNAIAYGTGPGPGDAYHNIWYSGATTSGCASAILAAVANNGNYTGNNTTYSPYTNNFIINCNPPNPTNTLISTIQGSGLTVTNAGTLVTVEAVVIGDHQANNELRGFFIQEEDTDQDGNAATSEGIFVYCNACPVNVAEGDLVEVTGLTTDFFLMSQIDVDGAGGSGNIQVISNNNLGLVTPVSLSLPAPAGTDVEATYEAYEGMLIEYATTLTVTEQFQLGRLGQFVLSSVGKLRQYTQDNQPSVAGYAAHLLDIAKRRIILDDYNDSENIDPVLHPVPGGGFSVSNYVRGGYTVNNLKGVMHWSWAGISGTDAWRIRPVKHAPVSFIASNPRTAAPSSVGGNLKVVSYNVLNYFNGNGTGGGFPNARGAHSLAEFNRQTDKIVEALIKIDGDIIALVELENDYNTGSNAAIASLVTALNAVAGAGTYAYVNPGGNVGTDAIANGFIYKQNVVSTVGAAAILSAASFTDPNNTGSQRNRPALAVTFEVTQAGHSSNGERFTIAANHLKSKGSSCGAGDDDVSSGQANCNGTRTLGAQALVAWLAADPTGSGDPDFMIVGDLNAYAMEDPIDAIKAAGYTDLTAVYSPGSTSFVFDGQWGSLDFGMSNGPLTSQVTGATKWNINADESTLLDYNDTIQDTNEQAWEAKPSSTPLYNADAYRSSDHDPVIIGLNLGGTCQANMYLPGTVNPSLYEVYNTITSDGTVANGMVDFSAGVSICLEPGFEALGGSLFTAYILGCIP